MLKLMKKFLCVFLALLTVFLFACSGEGDSTTVTSSSEEATTDTCEHAFSEFTHNGSYTCEGKGIFTRSCSVCQATEEEYREMKNEAPKTVSLDGKKVMFIGNSFVYYGNCVINGSQGGTDNGYFYQIAKANGENVTVYDYVYGGKNLDYIYTNSLPKTNKSLLNSIDYVFISEAGENNGSLVADVQKIMDLFPDTTQFVYLCHAYTYQANHTKLQDCLDDLQRKGVTLVNWGKLVYDVWKGTTKVPGATQSYNKESFIKNNKGVKNGTGSVGSGSNGDSHHQNPLSGYITAQMAYCAVTGKSAVGQDYSFCDNSSIHKYFDIDKFKAAHYNGSYTTNFDVIFRSPADMAGLQQLMDQYNEKNNARPSSVVIRGEHKLSDEKEVVHKGSANTDGIEASTCVYCGEKMSHTVKSSDTSRKNVMLITPAELKATGVKTAKDYMLAGKGNVFYKTEKGWGRVGYSSIQGMASVCDGNREAKLTNDGSVLYWAFADVNASFNSNGATGGRYCALIGYEFKESVKVNGFSIFIANNGAVKSFDLLGGVKQADGTIKWTVLDSCGNLNTDSVQYGENTVFYSADFDMTEIDYVQIGIVKANSSVFYASELELYGE